MSKDAMATAADIIIAPSPARPDMAGARKDTSAADTVDPTFSEVLDAEFPAPVEPSQDTASTPPPAAVAQSQLSPANSAAILIALQQNDNPAAQGTPNRGGDATAPTPVVSAGAPAKASDNAAAQAHAGAGTASSAAAAPSPQGAAAPAGMEAPAPLAAGGATATPAADPILPATAASATASPGAAAMTAATLPPQRAGIGSGEKAAPKDSVSTTAPSTVSTAEPAPDTGAATKASSDAVLQASAPVTSTAPATAQGTVSSRVPVATESPSPAPESSPGAQRAADRMGQVPANEAPPSSAKPASQSAAATASPAQSATNAATTQAAVKAAANGPSPEIKAEVAAPASAASASATEALASRGAAGDIGRAAQTHPALQAAPAAALQVYTRFIERFDGRAQRFEVRLDPAELGRIDVRIEVGADRKVHAILAAHDSAALNDLMRGQRALERALADAGIDLSDGGIEFELAEDSGRGLAGNHQRGDAWASREEAHVWRGFSSVNVSVEAQAADLATAMHPYTWRTARLDLVA